MEKLWQLFGRSLNALLGIIAVFYGLDLLIGTEESVVSDSTIMGLLARYSRALGALLMGTFFIDFATGAHITRKLEKAPKQVQFYSVIGGFFLVVFIFFLPFLECETIWCIFALFVPSALLVGFVAVFCSSALSDIYPENSLIGRLELWSYRFMSLIIGLHLVLVVWGLISELNIGG